MVKSLKLPEHPVQTGSYPGVTGIGAPSLPTVQALVTWDSWSTALSLKRRLSFQNGRGCVLLASSTASGAEGSLAYHLSGLFHHPLTSPILSLALLTSTITCESHIQFISSS